MVTYRYEKRTVVYARRLTSEDSVNISTRTGMDYDGDKYIRYREGDYIIFDPEREEIRFIKKDEFDKSVAP